MTSPLSLIGEEAVARAINPAEWNWYDKAPDDPAAPSFHAQSLNRARAAMSAHLAALKEAGQITIPLADYKRLLEAAESDDMIEWCEVCGAWLDKDDPARATADDFTGCWKVATRQEKDTHLCRSYRALD